MQPIPAPCSVLIMDNHSIHRSDRLTEMCAERGVDLVYLPPYSPEFNPIEQSFAQLKNWMRRHQDIADLYQSDFEGFIRLALRLSMAEGGARGHFKRCGYGTVEEEDEDDGSESEDDIDDILRNF
jgi:hypothetical protein